MHACVSILVVVEAHIVCLCNTFHPGFACIDFPLHICNSAAPLCGDSNASILELLKIDRALSPVFDFVEGDIGISRYELRVVETESSQSCTNSLLSRNLSPLQKTVKAASVGSHGSSSCSP